MEKASKNTKGITLIALVITIIILLILAGISIAALSGENGLIKRAANAKENTEIAEETEIIQQAVARAIGKSKSGDVQKEDLEEALANNSNIQGITVGSKGFEIALRNDRVYIVDTDGNVTYKKPRVYTEDVKDKLKIEGTNSPWVKFENNEQKYRVLYDASNPYGIEITSVTNMGEDCTLGKDDPAGKGKTGSGTLESLDRAIWSYTNAIETLNKAAEERVKAVNPPEGLIDDIRCIGSRPSNKNFKITEKYSNTLTPKEDAQEFNNFNGLWEQGERVESTNDGVVIQNDNYTEDYNQMKKLKILSTGGYYWVASRLVSVKSHTTWFNVNAISTGLIGSAGRIFVVGSSGKPMAQGRTYGVRPVIRLTDSGKILNGDGSEDSPYVLSK